jgi:hypothetical protein
MRESRMYGVVRGALSNGRSYREHFAEQNLLYQWDRIFLVTIVRGPCVLRLDDVGGDIEMAVEFLDVGVGGRGLTDAQACAIVGWQDDGADLMGFEDVAYRGPRCVHAVVEQRLLDRDQR